MKYTKEDIHTGMQFKNSYGKGALFTIGERVGEQMRLTANESSWKNYNQLYSIDDILKHLESGTFIMNPPPTYEIF